MSAFGLGVIFMWATDSATTVAAAVQTSCTANITKCSSSSRTNIYIRHKVNVCTASRVLHSAVAIIPSPEFIYTYNHKQGARMFSSTYINRIRQRGANSWWRDSRITRYTMYRTIPSKQDISKHVTNEYPTEDELRLFIEHDREGLGFHRRFWCKSVHHLTPEIARKFIGKDVCVLVGTAHIYHNVRDYTWKNKVAHIRRVTIVREKFDNWCVEFDVQDGDAVFGVYGSDILYSGSGASPVYIFLAR